MTIIPEKMVAGGTALGRIDGKAVFVPYALPGETLEIEIVERKKDYDFARVVSVIEPSEHRVAPRCPLFGRCGGCTLQMADAEYQVELRKSILEDVLSRARVRCETPLTVVTGASWEYRSRFQFHRTKDGGIGLREGSSSTVVGITDCPVAAPVVRRAIADGTIARNARQRNSSDRFHVFGCDIDLWQEDCDSSCAVSLSGKTVRFDVRGFFQSNVPMLERLVDRIGSSLPGRTGGAGLSVGDTGCEERDAASPGKRLLDCYAGVGTFSVALGDWFDELVLLEHNKEALEKARENLAARDGAARFCAVSDERWPSRAESRLDYDMVIVDPPRAGIHRATLDWLVSSGMRDIRAVSCDPVTFARDAARLIAGGFALRELTLFDFYPQTHHIETLARFER